MLRASRRPRVLVGLLACLAFAAVSAAPASAILVKLPNGKYAGFQAILGSKADKAIKSSARPYDAAFNNLDYSGGPVMPSNTNYVVVWQPSNYGSHTAFQTGYTAGVSTFLSDLAHDSGGQHNSDAVSAQYNDVNGNHAAYNSHYAGTLTDTDPLPANGCPANFGDICITDAQIQSELNSFLGSQGVPHDLSHEYFLLTPPDVASCFDSQGNSCSANADQNTAFCAYHSQSSGGYIYSNIPDLSGVFGCDPFVTSCPNLVCFYNNGPADGVLSAVSHEHNESITDPQPNNAWTDWQCTVSCSGVQGGEIGDKCNNDGTSDTHLVTQDDGSGDDTPYNEVINGRHYLVQTEWSNQVPGNTVGTGADPSCADGYVPNGTTVHASFTQSTVSGNTMTFNASASSSTGHPVAFYVWQFNDGPGQTITVETQSPTATIQHTFPSAGIYNVALTVNASDGSTQGTAHLVHVGSSPPTARFTVSGSPTEGKAVSFNGTGSTDPNQGGSISSYSWNFGDGHGASGATPSHVFASAGAYNVTLTVTDNFGQQNAVSHGVVVVDETPSGHGSWLGFEYVGFPIFFTATGTDPDGSIASFSWNFGDGHFGSGANPSHTYTHAGNYTVSVVLHDIGGQSTTLVGHLTIGPPRCVVPSLKGMTLASAKGLIKSFHCAVGKVHKPGPKPNHGPGPGKHWAQVVKKESPRAFSVRPVGTKVALTLVWKAI